MRLPDYLLSMQVLLISIVLLKTENLVFTICPRICPHVQYTVVIFLTERWSLKYVHVYCYCNGSKL